MCCSLVREASLDLWGNYHALGTKHLCAWISMHLANLQWSISFQCDLFYLDWSCLIPPVTVASYSSSKSDIHVWSFSKGIHHIAQEERLHHFTAIKGCDLNGKCCILFIWRVIIQKTCSWNTHECPKRERVNGWNIWPSITVLPLTIRDVILKKAIIAKICFVFCFKYNPYFPNCSPYATNSWMHPTLWPYTWVL